MERVLKHSSLHLKSPVSFFIFLFFGIFIFQQKLANLGYFQKQFSMTSLVGMEGETQLGSRSQVGAEARGELTAGTGEHPGVVEPTSCVFKMNTKRGQLFKKGQIKLVRSTQKASSKAVFTSEAGPSGVHR